MRVAIGQQAQEGPWGGGNNFIRSLARGLAARGHETVYDLDSGAVDIAVMIDPRARNPRVTFTPGRLLRYVMRNPRTLVVHRINECDERKGTHTMNWRLKLANHAADHTVFIATWLEHLPLWRGESGHSVLLNGADTSVFHANGFVPWDGDGPLRLVTHHWGANRMKGFDVYDRLDAVLDAPEWRDRLAFTYIGNLPAGVEFNNIRHIKPLSGEPLAAALRRHHAYFTASINEPAGMHHIEGALCGLPLIFRDSGGLPDYCTGFGEAFTGPDDFMDAIDRMIGSYDRWRNRMADYPHTAERMVADYIALFEALLADRDALMARRRTRPLSFLLNQIPW